MTAAPLAGYDWEQAFEVACRDSGLVERPVVVEDVAEVIAAVVGENDGPDWVAAVLLRDGRYAVVVAGCDYTGWGCQDGGRIEFADTRAELVWYRLGEEERTRLGLGAEPRPVDLALAALALSKERAPVDPIVAHKSLYALRHVAAERDRQDAKFGDQSHLPDGLDGMTKTFGHGIETCGRMRLADAPTWAAILLEEVGEALQADREDGRADDLRLELVQVAAVAVAWIEAIDRRGRCRP